MRHKESQKGTSPEAFKRLDTFFQRGPGISLDGQNMAGLNGEELIRKAKEKVAFIENEAYEKGYAQGEKDGFEFGRQKFVVALQNLSKIIHEIDFLKSTLYEKFEEEIIGLVLTIAKKVVHHEINTNPELIRYVVRAAMEHIVENSRVIIRVHPYDFNFVDEIKNDFLQEIAGLKHTEIMEDRSIKQGGCILETELGDIDATLDAQFLEIEERIDSVSGRKNVGRNG